VLLQVPADELHGAGADVEVDVDMESYEHATYLWGAFVTNNVGLEGIEEGYRAFVTFDELTDEAEAEIFADFWTWLTQLRTAVRAKGRSFRAYCFWRAAEESQMKRAAEIGAESIPAVRELERFFRSSEWVDLHELSKNQLLTEGPLGLKVLAGYAGFSWRDEDPSGEASIAWYEEAIGDDQAAAQASRLRLLAYNEDDVLATRALRRWLEGPARVLPHVDEVLPQRR
jgi:predicted RecB family nuclease